MAYLDNAGLTYLWVKLKAYFAKKAHTHAKGDITDFPLTLPANGGNADTLQGHGIAIGGGLTDPRNKIPCVNATGDLEIGNILDFHSSYAAGEDYAVRLTGSSGKLFVSGDLELAHGKSLILSAVNAAAGRTSIHQSIHGLDYAAFGSHVHRFLNHDNIWAEVQARGFSQQSSRRFKENIVDMTDAQARQLLRIGIKQFDYINGAKAQFGAIAEEVVEIQPQSVYLDAQGLPNAIGYAEYTPQLIKLCQIQQAQIDALTARMDAITT